MNGDLLKGKVLTVDLFKTILKMSTTAFWMGCPIFKNSPSLVKSL